MVRSKNTIMPAGPLMKEHRIIERVIKLMAQKLEETERTKAPDLKFIGIAVDFLRTYADRCHHGKEEDILFRRLGKKPLSAEHKAAMDGLINDHIYARDTIKRLISAKERYEKGDKSALGEITARENDLTALYPRHIEIEDKHFFLPSMKYFSEEEQARMLEEFRVFDSGLIHEKYKAIAERLES